MLRVLLHHASLGRLFAFACAAATCSAAPSLHLRNSTGERVAALALLLSLVTVVPVLLISADNQSHRCPFIAVHRQRHHRRCDAAAETLTGSLRPPSQFARFSRQIIASHISKDDVIPETS